VRQNFASVSKRKSRYQG